jgi:alkylation response protein AidB-like acyl-CoA dehydrogenase
MLDFSFTPQQEQLRRTLREFALKELLPHYGRWDREGQYPREQVRKICRLVWADLPEDMGCRAVPRGQLFLDEVRVPAASLVGHRGGGFKMILSYLDVNRAFIGLKCQGAAQQTLDETITYVKTRQQFGRPISRFQGVAFPLAEAATLIEAARWLCYKILWKRERGEPCTLEGAMELIIARHLLGREFAPET